MKTIRAGKKAHPPVLSGLSDQDLDALASYLNGAQ
jgi:cytochrome c553